MSISLSHSLELQGRMVRIRLEQGKLLIGAIANLLRKRKILMPEIGRRMVSHQTS